jgi:hypothetical protein
MTDEVSIAFDPFDTMIVGWATVTSKMRLSVVTWPEMRIVRFDAEVRVPLAYEKPTVPYEFAVSRVSYVIFVGVPVETAIGVVR